LKRLDGWFKEASNDGLELWTHYNSAEVIIHVNYKGLQSERAHGDMISLTKVESWSENRSFPRLDELARILDTIVHYWEDEDQLYGRVDCTLSGLIKVFNLTPQLLFSSYDYLRQLALICIKFS